MAEACCLWVIFGVADDKADKPKVGAARKSKSWRKGRDEAEMPQRKRLHVELSSQLISPSVRSHVAAAGLTTASHPVSLAAPANFVWASALWSIWLNGGEA